MSFVLPLWRKALQRSTVLGAVAALLLLAGIAGAPPAHAEAGTSVLRAGESLLAGQALTSPSGALNLFMQGDGNLVLYAPGMSARWQSNTSGNPGARLVMQGDGNLVVYSAANVPLWYTRTNGSGAAVAEVQDDGNFVVYTADWRAVWNSGTRYFPSAVASPVTLAPGAGLQSPNGAYTALFQTDGNFVLSGPAGLVWQSGTAGRGATQLAVQDDGNLVVVGPAGPIWYTRTYGNGQVILQMQDDGNLVLYTTAYRAIWASSWAIASPVPSIQSIETGFMASGGDFDGKYGLQCVDLVKWFIVTYTNLNVVNGDGWQQVNNLIARNPGLVSSTTPRALSIYSVKGGVTAWGSSGGAAGHTGIVVSVTGNQATVIETGSGLAGQNPNSKVSTYPFPADGVTFTYVGGNLR